MRVYHKPLRDGRDRWYAIDYDEYPDNPRSYDNLGTFITYNKGYSPDNYSEDFVDIVRMLYGSSHVNEHECKVRTEGGVNYVVLPVYIYQHSYIAYSTHSFIGRSQHAEWDSGLAGLIYADEDEIKEWYDVEEITKEIIDKVKEEFETECEEYTHYCNGEYIRWDEYAFEDNVFEQIDGCGGYYDIEQIENELELPADDFKDYPSIEALELELLRNANNKKLTEGN